MSTSQAQPSPRPACPGVACLCLVNLFCTVYAQEQMPMLCVVNYRDPVAPERLKQARIDTVYIGVGVPLAPADDGNAPALDPDVQPSLDEFMALYADHGIRVLIESNFYSRPPKGTECVDAAGRKIRIGCFNNERFLEWTAQTVHGLATAFTRYSAFAGFLFDDGVQVRCDCCYCDVCTRAFRDQYRVAPPEFTPTEGTGRIDENDPRLLWDAFHQDAYSRYLRTQAEAAAAVSPDLDCLTIPSDSFFFGRHLNSTAAHDATPLTAGARLQRIDRYHVRDWRLFQSFPVLRVVPHGSGREPYATGCHLTTPSPCMILQQEGPLFETHGRQQFLSPGEISRLVRTTVAEGADALGFWEDPNVFPHYGPGFQAIGSAAADLERVRPLLRERRPFPARVGLLYSTATEVLQQPWPHNTLERWRHLHAFEACAFALTRASVQFRTMLDSELTDDALADLSVLILAGVTHLTADLAKRLERAVESGGLTVLTDPSSLHLRGGTVVRFDAHLWFRSQLEGYRHQVRLEEQVREIRSYLLPWLDVPGLQPVWAQSDSCFAKLFSAEDGSLLLFVANWDTRNPSAVVVCARGQWRLRGEPQPDDTGPRQPRQRLETVIPAAGWRVLRCTRR